MTYIASVCSERPLESRGSYLLFFCQSDKPGVGGVGGFSLTVLFRCRLALRAEVLLVSSIKQSVMLAVENRFKTGLVSEVKRPRSEFS